MIYFIINHKIINVEFKFFLILQTKYPIETLDKISNFGYRASVFSPFAREKDLLRKQFSSMSYSFDSPVQRQSGKIENKKMPLSGETAEAMASLLSGKIKNQNKSFFIQCGQKRKSRFPSLISCNRTLASVRPFSFGTRSISAAITFSPAILVSGAA